MFPLGQSYHIYMYCRFCIQCTLSVLYKTINRDKMFQCRYTYPSTHCIVYTTYPSYGSNIITSSDSDVVFVFLNSFISNSEFFLCRRAARSGKVVLTIHSLLIAVFLLKTFNRSTPMEC